MRITVRFFAILRDSAGKTQLQLDLPAGLTAASAVQCVAEQIPPIRHLLDRVAVAVNRAYVPRDTVLHDGDELALIPPVSGG